MIVHKPCHVLRGAWHFLTISCPARRWTHDHLLQLVTLGIPLTPRQVARNGPVCTQTESRQFHNRSDAHFSFVCPVCHFPSVVFHKMLIGVIGLKWYEAGLLGSFGLGFVCERPHPFSSQVNKKLNNISCEDYLDNPHTPNTHWCVGRMELARIKKAQRERKEVNELSVIFISRRIKQRNLDCLSQLFFSLFFFFFCTLKKVPFSSQPKHACRVFQR